MTTDLETAIRLGTFFVVNRSGAFYLIHAIYQMFLSACRISESYITVPFTRLT